LRDGSRLTISIPGGGVWHIDPPLFSRVARLVGRRVRVIGVRGGFDLVEAKRIYAA
jgi:hypothetical protein